MKYILRRICRRKRTKRTGQRSGGEEFMRRYREMTADMEPPVRRQDITVKGIGSFSLRQSEPIPIS